VPSDVAFQVDLVARLFAAALLGGIIGVEREIRDQQAGLRTHLLVALGSALFTVVSIFGFANLPPGAATGAVDPSRVAAQIVTGVGFLGAGAIIRQGIAVRGLTTAASLWATAAVGLAAGAGQLVVAIASVVIIVVTLGPLARIAHWLRRMGTRELDVHLTLDQLEALGTVTNHLTGGQVEIAGIQTRAIEGGRFDLQLKLALAAHGHPSRILDELSNLPGVHIVDAGEPRDEGVALTGGRD
jgi:putative Mg2+ transporter-C (MgtC) family protein